MKAQSNRSRGFTLLEIMIISGIVGLVAVIAVPNLIRSRLTAQKSGCIANLKQIESGVTQWAVETKKASTDTCNLTDPAFLVYMKGSVLPICPGGGVYTAGTNINSPPICNQFTVGHTL